MEEKLYAPVVENLKSKYDYWYLDASQTVRDLFQFSAYLPAFRQRVCQEKKMEAALKYEQVFRGNVIIGKCGDDGKDLRIDPRLANKIPKEFARFCRL